ncbi:hypothetical protein HK096_007217, partial [Nowakowskiella sp. JEL0078]
PQITHTMRSDDLLDKLKLTSKHSPKLKDAFSYLSLPKNSPSSVLLVGEGDFSFSQTLALNLDTAILKSSTFVATSLDSISQIKEKYGAEIVTRLQSLKERFHFRLIHNVDATKLAKDDRISTFGSYDRIIFNFPHIGGGKDEDISKNVTLLEGFFLHARKLLSEDDESQIIVTLRQTPVITPYKFWH